MCNDIKLSLAPYFIKLKFLTCKEVSLGPHTSFATLHSSSMLVLKFATSGHDRGVYGLFLGIF